MRQKFIQKCIRIFITKCDSYYKMRRLSQNATFIKIARVLKILNLILVIPISILQEKLHKYSLLYKSCNLQVCNWIPSQVLSARWENFYYIFFILKLSESYFWRWLGCGFINNCLEKSCKNIFWKILCIKISAIVSLYLQL